ncbi:uncharacterized protein KY384_003659 [Bacidia gigantensis]|uniref:uncharacterized protein n=1 Tax=Bacidia gigantensis TaxID=2732470 RepID=UPI001D039D25|nr:uncharacterized protein KY384_003659 [Bacidia gigantensis]KAG8532023.1 hypothetical protein KY384_003659 [Bacidia gigantensis]
MSLKSPDLKMSKSHMDDLSKIYINDTSEQISNKIRLALTDSIPGISYDPKLRPGVSNLLELLSHFDTRSRAIGDLVRDCGDLSMREFKLLVASSVDKGLVTIRDRFTELLEPRNQESLEALAHDGALKAREIARGTISRVKDIIGLSII